MNLDLLPQQQTEDYYSKRMDKSRRIHKTNQDIFLKFTEGLPPQLAVFVRAGNPEDIQASLTASKIYGRGGHLGHVTSTIGIDFG